MIKGKRRPLGAKKDSEIKVTREHEIMRRREEEKEHTMNRHQVVSWLEES